MNEMKQSFKNSNNPNFNYGKFAVIKFQSRYLIPLSKMRILSGGDVKKLKNESRD